MSEAADPTEGGTPDELEALRATVSGLMRGLNHDLKNPLGAADGYLDLLLQGFRGDLTDEQKQTLERVRALIASGIDILEDVVAFARATIGELNPRPAPTELDALTRMALELHQARAGAAGITIGFEGANGAARTVTDPELVGRIVDRLLANALDHTPDGGRVVVRVGREDGAVTVTVADSGPGVPEADRERVFREFERGSAPVRPRTTSGIGFGLPLARAMAERLDGRLYLLKADGDAGGAAFRLELPLRD